MDSQETKEGVKDFLSMEVDGADEENTNISELPAPFQDLVTNLETYESPIPDSLTRNVMESCGLETDDPRVLRLLSLCAHKFMMDIISDSLHHAKVSQGGPGMRKTGKDKKYTLTPDDLEPALRENGIVDGKAPYHL